MLDGEKSTKGLNRPTGLVQSWAFIAEPMCIRRMHPKARQKYAWPRPDPFSTKEPVMSRFLNRGLLLSSLVLLGLCQAGQAQEWKETKSKEGNFKALFPTEAAPNSQDIPTALGKIKMYTFSSETDGGKIAYLVMYNDYPLGKLDVAAQEKILRDARDGAIAKAQGKIKTIPRFSWANIRAGSFNSRASTRI
jgi:hypothetical protein